MGAPRKHCQKSQPVCNVSKHNLVLPHTKQPPNRLNLAGSRESRGVWPQGCPRKPHMLHRGTSSFAENQQDKQDVWRGGCSRGASQQLLFGPATVFHQCVHAMYIYIYAERERERYVSAGSPRVPPISLTSIKEPATMPLSPARSMTNLGDGSPENLKRAPQVDSRAWLRGRVTGETLARFPSSALSHPFFGRVSLLK